MPPKDQTMAEETTAKVEQNQAAQPSAPILYGYDYQVDSDLDLIENLLFQYSCARVARGDTPVVLREQLRTLLAFYFTKGYSRDTKEFAMEVFNIKENTMATMDHDLKKLGYLVADPMNNRQKYLNDELKELKEYVGKVDKTGNKTYYMLHVIHIKTSK